MKYSNLVSLYTAIKELRLKYALEHFDGHEVKFFELMNLLFLEQPIKYFTELTKEELDGNIFVLYYMPVSSNGYNSDAELIIQYTDLGESWVPITNSQLEVLNLVNQGERHYSVIPSRSAANAFFKQGVNISEIEISDDGMLVTRLKTPIYRTTQNIKIHRQDIVVFSSILLKVIFESVGANINNKSESKAWLRNIMATDETKEDNLLDYYVDKIIELERFPLMSELKSVFMPLAKPNSKNELATKLVTVKKSDPDDIKESHDELLGKAKERVARIYMKNFLKHCFNLE